MSAVRYFYDAVASKGTGSKCSIHGVFRFRPTYNSRISSFRFQDCFLHQLLFVFETVMQ